MDAADKPTSVAGRKALDDPRIHRYYVRLTSEQNERFLRMYEQSGMPPHLRMTFYGRR